jgi:hypothetical protein
MADEQHVQVYEILEEPEVISMKVGTRGIEEGDGETTGITEMKDAAVDRGEWYNLNGQRVERPNKGLYIKDGKKVLIK